MLTKPYPQIEEWLRSHTIEEINAICNEAKADDEADGLLNSDFVHAEMERLNPWMCKLQDKFM